MKALYPESRAIDIGIITIIPTEIDALFSSLGINAHSYEDIDSPLDYWKTSFYSKQSKKYVSIVVSIISGDSGNTETAILTANFLRDWHPRLMCLVGIAAGINGKIKIGDVVIPNKIHDRTIKVFVNGKYSVRSSTLSRNEIINKMLKVFPISQDEFEVASLNVAQQELKICKLVAKEKGFKEHEFSDKQYIRDGSIVSDNILIRDSAYFSPLLDDVDEKCRGGEMEASGFVCACQAERADFPWIVFRGVSDFGDKRKDDSFQLVAAKNACTSLKLFIENSLNINLLPENPRALTSLNTLEFNLIHQVKRAFESSKWQEVCRIGSILSRPLWLAGQYNLRVELGKIIESSASYCGNSSLRARTLIDDLGWTIFKLGNKEEAKKNISDGIRLAKECKDYYAVSKGFRHLASINRQGNELTKATGLLTQCKMHAEKIDDRSLKIEMMSSLKVSKGKLLMSQGSYDQAFEQLKNALDQFISNHDYEREVKIYSLLGIIEEKRENYPAAKSFYMQGKKKAGALGRFDELAYNTSKLIRIIGSTNQEEIEALKDEVYNFAIANGLWSEAKKWCNKVAI